MNKSVGSVALILGGVGLVYLAITGYTANVWNAIRGGTATDPSIPVDAGNSEGAAPVDSSKPVHRAGAVWMSQGGGAGRATGRGLDIRQASGLSGIGTLDDPGAGGLSMGGAAAAALTPVRNVFYPTPAGGVNSGGQVANAPSYNAGVFYPTASGGINSSNEGIW